MAEDKTRHQEKWAKAVVGLATKVWKGGLLLAWFLSMTEGLSWWTRINQGKCVEWLFLARFGSNSVFLVIEWHRQPAGHPPVKACHHLLKFLFLYFYPLYVYPLHSRRGKKLAERLGNLRRRIWTQRIKWSVCWRSKKHRARKTKICGKATPWLGRVSKQSGRQSHRGSRHLRRVCEW